MYFFCPLFYTSRFQDKMEEERSSRAPIDLAIFQSLELKSIELTQQLNEQVASIQQQMNKVRKQPKCGERQF
jgi:hypothetical protein